MRMCSLWNVRCTQSTCWSRCFDGWHSSWFLSVSKWRSQNGGPKRRPKMGPPRGTHSACPGGSSRDSELSPSYSFYFFAFSNIKFFYIGVYHHKKILKFKKYCFFSYVILHNRAELTKKVAGGRAHRLLSSLFFCFFKYQVFFTSGFIIIKIMQKNTEFFFRMWYHQKNKGLAYSIYNNNVKNNIIILSRLIEFIYHHKNYAKKYRFFFLMLVHHKKIKGSSLFYHHKKY